MSTFAKQLRSGDGRLLNVAQVAETYKNIYSLAVPTGGKLQKFGENNYGIANSFTTFNANKLESIKTAKFYSLSINLTKDGDRYIESVRCVSDSYQLSEVASTTSENGRFTAKLKTGGVGKQILEIWERSRLLQTFDTSEIGAHGSINTDPLLSNFTWSKFGDQDKLLYVCQPKRPKCLSFFKGLGDLKEDNMNAKRGEEYNKREDWGECMDGIEHTMVAILDVSDNFKITTIDVEEFSLGDPQWLDNGTKVVSVAYQEQLRRRGIAYCNNKPSKLMIHDWKSSIGDNKRLVTELSQDGRCFSSPRVNQVGNKFIYLSSAAEGSSYGSVKLFEHNIRTKADRKLSESTTGIDDFFIHNLPKNCFTTNDKQILFIATDYLHLNMCLFNLENEKLEKIKFPTTGVDILDFHHDIILATGSEVNATPTLFVAVLNQCSDVVAWHQIEDCIHLDEIEFKTFKIPAPEDTTSFISCLLVQPNPLVLQENYPSRLKPQVDSTLISNQNQLPTIVNVHGGPCAQTVVRYAPYAAFCARLGLRTLFINYRGSTGVSEQYLQCLLGRVGDLDVKDCNHALRYLVNSKLLDSSKLIIQGTSHGGFLAAHLCCQDEFKFTSAIIGNPLISFLSLFETTDIPECCSAYILRQNHFDTIWQPDCKEINRMFECSPISKVDKANVPTLMLLGKRDRRIPMFQGERWLDKLRARGVETLCKVYNDKHSLSKAESVADGNMTALIWILDHLNR